MIMFGKVPAKVLYITVAVFVAIVLAVAVAMFLKKRAHEGFENNGKARTVLYWAAWCPYCTRTLPAWCKLRAVIMNETKCKLTDVEQSKLESAISGFNVDMIRQLRDKVVIQEYESDENKALFSEQGIKSFPTIVLHTADGKKIKFEGEEKRTLEGFVAFLKKHLL